MQALNYFLRNYQFDYEPGYLPFHTNKIHRISFDTKGELYYPIIEDNLIREGWGYQKDGTKSWLEPIHITMPIPRVRTGHGADRPNFCFEHSAFLSKHFDTWREYHIQLCDQIQCPESESFKACLLNSNWDWILNYPDPIWVYFAIFDTPMFQISAWKSYWRSKPDMVGYDSPDSVPRVFTDFGIGMYLGSYNDEAYLPYDLDATSVLNTKHSYNGESLSIRERMEIYPYAFAHLAAQGNLISFRHREDTQYILFVPTPSSHDMATELLACLGDDAEGIATVSMAEEVSTADKATSKYFNQMKRLDEVVIPTLLSSEHQEVFVDFFGKNNARYIPQGGGQYVLSLIINRYKTFLDNIRQGANIPRMYHLMGAMVSLIRKGNEKEYKRIRKEKYNAYYGEILKHFLTGADLPSGVLNELKLSVEYKMYGRWECGMKSMISHYWIQDAYSIFKAWHCPDLNCRHYIAGFRTGREKMLRDRGGAFATHYNRPHMSCTEDSSQYYHGVIAGAMSVVPELLASS